MLHATIDNNLGAPSPGLNSLTDFCKLHAWVFDEIRYMPCLDQKVLIVNQKNI